MNAAAQEMAALQLAGAARFDPVRWHYLEALALRTQTQAEPVQRILAARLAQALADFQRRFNEAQGAAQSGLPTAATIAQDASKPPARTVDAAPTTLGELTRYLATQAPAKEGGDSVAAPASPELKSVRQFRNTWSKLSANKQLAQALDTAPKNAGPINSHMLVLRSLALMREISPDYLNRFMSYADTLLCLDLGAAEEPSDSKAAKPRRSRAR